MNNQKSIVKNTFYRGILSFFNLVVPLLVVPYIYRILSPESVGNYEYSTSIFNYFNLFGVLGIYTYGLREISRKKDNYKFVSETYRNLFYIGVLSNLVALCFFLIFSNLVFFHTTTGIVLLILSFNFIGNIFYTEWVNESFEDFRFIAIKTIVIRSLYVLLLFLFVKDNSDIYIYVSLTVLSNIINYLISFIYSIKYTNFHFCGTVNYKLLLKHYFPSLFLILILNNSSIFYTLFDRVMLGTFNGKEEVAYYSVGQKLMEMIRSLLLTLTFVSLPRLSYYLTHNYDCYEKNVKSLLNCVIMLSCPICVGLCALGEDIIKVFVGNQYEMSIMPLYFFSFRIITLMVENITAQQILFLNNKEKMIVLFNLSFGILNIILNFSLLSLHFFNPTTAIASTLFAELFLLYVEITYIRRKLHLQINIFTINNLKYLFLSLLIIPIVMCVKFFIQSHIIMLIVCTLVSSIVYFTCLFLTKDNTLINIMVRLKIYK